MNFCHNKAGPPRWNHSYLKYALAQFVGKRLISNWDSQDFNDELSVSNFRENVTFTSHRSSRIPQKIMLLRVCCTSCDLWGRMQFVIPTNWEYQFFVKLSSSLLNHKSNKSIRKCSKASASFLHELRERMKSLIPTEDEFLVDITWQIKTSFRLWSDALWEL